MKKLSIAVIQQSPDLGGAEFFMLSLLKELKKDGVGIRTAADKGKFFNELKKNNFSPTLIPQKLDIIGNYKGLVKSVFFLPFLIPFYIKLLTRYKKNGVDVLLMSGFSEKMLVSFLSIFIRIPVVWIEYGPLDIVFKRNFYIPYILYRTLQLIPKYIIVPAKNTNKSLEEAGVLQKKLTLIPCGIKVSSPKGKPRRILKPKGKLVVGNVSRAAKEKGQEYVINCIPEVLKAIPDAHFIFVGTGPDIEFFKEQARNLGVEDATSFYDFVDSLEDYYRLMDVFVFPSVWELEGFGLVAVEAMSYKIPVIGNNHGPIKETLGNGAGILVNVKNKKELTKAIINLLKNEKIRKEFGEVGFKKVKELYDIEKVSKQYKDILLKSKITI